MSTSTEPCCPVDPASIIDPIQNCEACRPHPRSPCREVDPCPSVFFPPFLSSLVQLSMLKSQAQAILGRELWPPTPCRAECMRNEKNQKSSTANERGSCELPAPSRPFLLSLPLSPPSSSYRLTPPTSTPHSSPSRSPAPHSCPLPSQAPSTASSPSSRPTDRSPSAPSLPAPRYPQ